MLKINKGGILTETKWVWDEEKDVGSYVTTDVTDVAIRSMWDCCELADDVVLQDIFLLLNTELDIFDAMIGNWCREIVTEGLKAPKIPDLTDGMEFLELYWMYDLCKKWIDDKELDEYELVGNSFPGFHGWGVWPMDKDCGVPEAVQGGYGVSFTPANELALYPLRLNKLLSITCDEDDRKNINFPNPGFTLGNILYGIIWELSFHGGPTSRDEQSEQLKAMVDKIKDGETDESSMD